MVTEADLRKYGFEEIEISEEFRQSFMKTGYPKPARRYRLHYEGYNISIEEPYFWTLHYLGYFGGFPRIDKITDVFAAAENSAFLALRSKESGCSRTRFPSLLQQLEKWSGSFSN